jgi:ribose-phosphate pyrophosphokinase
MVITDSIEPTAAIRSSDRLRVISIAPLMGEAIARTASEKSVSSLFD